MKNMKTDIVGVWKLKSRIDTTASGVRVIDPIMGADPMGILCFSGDQFAAQFMKRDRSEVRDSPQPFQGQNNSAAVNGYDAYFGTYTYDEGSGTLKTLLEGSIAPVNIGKVFERHLEVRGSELTIALATTAVDGTQINRKLTFARLS